MSGTITLPSGDKLITQLETLSSGALVHREEVVVSGTISGRLALPTSTQPISGDFGLPVWEINDPKRVALVNVGVSGTPLRVDPTGTTTQPVSISSTVTVSLPGTPTVIVSSIPSISFSSPQPISSVAGTVQVAFVPSAVQSVNLLNVGFAGTPIRTDPTGQTTQPVSLSGSISLADYSRYSEQLTQSSRLSTIDTDILAVRNAVIGTPAVKFASAQEITWSGTPSVNVSALPPISFFGQQPVHGTVVVSSLPSVTISSLPAITFTSPQPISSIAGTVRVDPTGQTTQPISWTGAPNVTVPGTPAVTIFGTPSVSISSLPAITFASPQPISTVAGTVSVVFPSAQLVTLSGSISLADYARYSEQITQSSRLSTIDTDILATTAAIKGTQAVTIFGTPSVSISGVPAVTFSGAQPISTVAGTVSVTFPSAQSVNIVNTPSVTFSGQQPVHGTVVISSLPAITFASAQPISTVAGTVNVAFTPTSLQSVALMNVGFAGTPLVTSFSGTPSVNIADMPAISLSPITFASPQPISTVSGTVSVSFSSTQSVSLAGSISLADYARYSEQLTQSSRLSTIDTDILATTAAIKGTQAITIFGTPTIIFSGAQPVSTVSGTVSVTFPSAQSVNLSGSISLADYARYSAQLTEITSLNAIDADIQAVRNAVIGTPAVKFASPQEITFSGQQPVHGTVVVSSIPSVTVISLPAITFASPQPISSVSGTVRIDPIGVTTQPVSISSAVPISTVAGTVSVTFPSTQSVNVANIPAVTFSGQQPVHGTVVVSSLPPITFASPQPISTIAGTVQVAFTPASVQSVNMTTAAAGGTVLALYAEQQTQTTSLQLIDDVVHVINAALGKIALVGGQRDDASTTLATEDAIVPFRVTSQRAIHNNWRNESGQEIGTSGTPVYIEVTGGITQPVSISTSVNIGAVAGTVKVAFAPEYTQNVNLLNVGFAGTPLRIDPTGTTTQPVSISGTISIPDYARYSEQITQTTSLQLLDDTVHAANAALGKVTAIGGQRDDESITLATENTISPIRITSYRAQHVSLRNEIGVEVGSAGTPLRVDPTGITTQPISFVGQQPIHGTVQIGGIPSVSISNTPSIAFSGQQPVHGTVQINGPLGGGIEAAAVRVTLATDSTGVISIDDNGGSITVDGEVNAKLLNYGHVGTPLRVDPTGTTIQPISWSGVPTVSIPGTIAVNIRNNIYTYKTARVDIGATGDNTLVSSVTNKRIKVYAINMNAERAGTVGVVWMDGTLPLSGTQSFSDREGYTFSVPPPAYLLAPQAGTALVAHVPTPLFTGGMRGWVSYFDDDNI